MSVEAELARTSENSPSRTNLLRVDCMRLPFVPKVTPRKLFRYWLIKKNNATSMSLFTAITTTSKASGSSI